MKLLFDENISYRIVKQVADTFPESLHVSRIQVTLPVNDRKIWEYAQKYNYIIVTFEEDFEDLSNLYGFPPKVILLRLGNSSPKTVVETLLKKKSAFSDNFCGTYIQPHPKSLSCQERDYVLPPSPGRRRDGDEVSHKNCQSSQNQK
jgi:predicted nuclease of predicted toxin-antitoxin system